MGRKRVSPTKKTWIQLERADGACDIENDPCQNNEGHELNWGESSCDVEEQEIDVHEKPKDHPRQNKPAPV